MAHADITPPDVSGNTVLLNALLKEVLAGPEDMVLPRGFQQKLRIAMGDAAIRKDAGDAVGERPTGGVVTNVAKEGSTRSSSTQTLNQVKSKLVEAHRGFGNMLNHADTGTPAFQAYEALQEGLASLNEHMSRCEIPAIDERALQAEISAAMQTENSDHGTKYGIPDYVERYAAAAVSVVRPYLKRESEKQGDDSASRDDSLRNPPRFTYVATTSEVDRIVTAACTLFAPDNYVKPVIKRAETIGERIQTLQDAVNAYYAARLLTVAVEDVRQPSSQSPIKAQV